MKEVVLYLLATVISKESVGGIKRQSFNRFFVGSSPDLAIKRFWEVVEESDEHREGWKFSNECTCEIVDLSELNRLVAGHVRTNTGSGLRSVS